MPGQIFGQTKCIGDVGVHAQGQSFEALKEQEGVERCQAGTEVAQLLDPQLGAETVLAEVVPETQTAVAGYWLGHAWETTVGPVEATAFHDHAAHGRAVAADELGRRVHHYVGAVLERAA